MIAPVGYILWRMQPIVWLGLPHQDPLPDASHNAKQNNETLKRRKEVYKPTGYSCHQVQKA